MDTLLMDLAKLEQEQPPLIKWPEPKFTPTAGGSQLNPKRVEDLAAAIKQELIVGEQIKLFAMLELDDLLADEIEKRILKNRSSSESGATREAHVEIFVGSGSVLEIRETVEAQFPDVSWLYDDADDRLEMDGWSKKGVLVFTKLQAIRTAHIQNDVRWNIEWRG